MAVDCNSLNTVVDFRAWIRAAELAAILKGLSEADADDWIQQALNERCSELTAAAEGRYATPLAATDQLKAYERDAARLTLRRRTGWNWRETEEKAEAAFQKLLEKITTRKANLTGQSRTHSPDDRTNLRPTGGGSRVTGRDRTFGQGKMDGKY